MVDVFCFVNTVDVESQEILAHRLALVKSTMSTELL